MENIFERHMFWLFLVLLLLILLNPIYVGVGSWNLNRTVGWGWDYPSFLRWFFFTISFLVLVFTIGYGFLRFTNRKTHFYLSLTHFLLVLFYWWPHTIAELYIIYLVVLLLVFLLNIFRSVKIPAS
jgi:hypothetical protein